MKKVKIYDYNGSQYLLLGHRNGEGVITPFPLSEKFTRFFAPLSELVQVGEVEIQSPSKSASAQPTPSQRPASAQPAPSQRPASAQPTPSQRPLGVRSVSGRKDLKTRPSASVLDTAHAARQRTAPAREAVPEFDILQHYYQHIDIVLAIHNEQFYRNTQASGPADLVRLKKFPRPLTTALNEHFGVPRNRDFYMHLYQIHRTVDAHRLPFWIEYLDRLVVSLMQKFFTA